MAQTFYKYWIRPWTMLVLMCITQGCAVGEGVVVGAFPDNSRYGLLAHDPCVRCGESMVTYIHTEELTLELNREDN